MKYLVSGKEMKEIDRRSIRDFGIPSLVLMERAALAVAEEAEKALRKRQAGLTENLRCQAKGKVWAVCGLGNNGADGVAAARMLFLHGADVMILLPGTEGRTTEEFDCQLAIAKKLGIPVCTMEDFIPGTCDLILDAVFGIGLSREVTGKYAEMIDFINAQEQADVISVDIPSGINADTGAVMGTAVKADVTVTFGERKLGQILFPGREECGRLLVADIGFVPEDEKTEASHICTCGPEDLKKIPKRRSDSHKGTYGRVLIVAGAKNMAGAAYFSALAAYRSGAGLVKVFTPEENRLMIQTKLPEAVLSTFDPLWAEENPEDFRECLKEQTGWADVIVLGPGIGKAEYAKTMVETVLSDAYVPIIMDADAINLAAEHSYLKGYFTENIILTPHILEMARLTGIAVPKIKSDPVGTARNFAEQYSVTCILKDAATVTARKDGKVYVNTSGSPAMAKGGSGDVLTGVLAGLIAIGVEECEAASLGVYLHGLAGERAEEKYGAHSVLAEELADCIGEVINVSV